MKDQRQLQNGDKKEPLKVNFGHFIYMQTYSSGPINTLICKDTTIQTLEILVIIQLSEYIYCIPFLN